MSNIIGDLYKVTTFGESHGLAIGCIIDGCPSGIIININNIQSDLNKRKPGTSKFVTQRNESDILLNISGLFNNITTGTPIGFIVKNYNQISSDYNNLLNIYRPGHADYVYYIKYGIRDYRGGGRSSARTTIALVIAGSLAKQINLSYFNIKVFCYISHIGNISILFRNLYDICIDNFFMPNKNIKYSVIKYLSLIKNIGDSVGACIILIITNILIGLGEPLFYKFTSELTKNIMCLNAVKSVEFGVGKNLLKLKGSINNDCMYDEGFLSNNSGGVLGGLSTSQDIKLTIYIKPTSSIYLSQKSINNNYLNVDLNIKGRHDPCVGLRAVPIIESITSITIINLLLKQKIIQFY